MDTRYGQQPTLCRTAQWTYVLASSVPLADDGAIPTYVHSTWYDKVEYSVVGRGPARNRALPCG